MNATPIITVRLFLAEQRTTTLFQIAMPEGEGLEFANMVAGALMDAMHDQSGLNYGYQVDTAAMFDAAPALGPLLQHVRGLVA